MKRLSISLLVLSLAFLVSPPAQARKLPLARTGRLPDIAEKAVPSIVNISSIKVVRYRSGSQISPFFNDPFFRHFFGENSISPFSVPREQRERSLGSGVIVSRDGHILTNNHVVEGASEVNVMLSDGTELQARIVGHDAPTDIALLQVKLPKAHTPLPIGDSDKLRLAETVLAIGSPFGLGGTVTMGIVSAKGRANVGVADYEDFIQTDAAINPGNSGGALINTRGELVGINTAIYSRSGGYQGIGFAIPINMARHVMAQLLRHGKVERGWLGVSYQNVTPDIAKALGLPKTGGAILTGVFKGSPADQAGLEPGDVILSYNDVPIRTAGHLSKFLSETPIGKTVSIRVKRNEQELKLRATIQNRPSSTRTRRRRR